MWALECLRVSLADHWAIGWHGWWHLSLKIFSLYSLLVCLNVESPCLLATRARTFLGGDQENTKILVVFLWSRGPRDDENQKNALVWDGNLTKRPREDQNSRGVLVVLWTTRPREPKECQGLGRRFNQETTRRAKFSWCSCGLVDHETTRTKRMPGPGMEI